MGGTLGTLKIEVNIGAISTFPAVLTGNRLTLTGYSAFLFGQTTSGLALYSVLDMNGFGCLLRLFKRCTLIGRVCSFSPLTASSVQMKVNTGFLSVRYQWDSGTREQWLAMRRA